jgi:hypothetical protein
MMAWYFLFGQVYKRNASVNLRCFNQSILARFPGLGNKWDPGDDITKEGPAKQMDKKLRNWYSKTRTSLGKLKRRKRSNEASNEKAKKKGKKKKAPTGSSLLEQQDDSGHDRTAYHIDMTIDDAPKKFTKPRGAPTQRTVLTCSKCLKETTTLPMNVHNCGYLFVCL